MEGECVLGAPTFGGKVAIVLDGCRFGAGNEGCYQDENDGGLDIHSGEGG